MSRSIPIYLYLQLLVLSAFGQPCDYSLRFSGVHTYVSCGPGAYYNDKSSLTVEAWVYLANPMNMQTVVGNLDPANFSGFCLGVQNGQLNCIVQDSVGSSQAFVAGPVPANKWTHLAMSYQRNGKFRGYVNGKLIINATATSYPIGNTGATDLVIGAAAWNRQLQVVDGFIDEVRIYNFQRSTADIRRDMRLRLPGGAPGMIGYWRFDEGVGTTTQDLSQGNHPGTLSGMVLPAWNVSTGPYGDGYSELSAASQLVFPIPGMELFPLSPVVNDTFVVSRISCSPNVLPAGSNTYTYDYWIVDHYDTTAGLTFGMSFFLESGDVDTADAITPSNFTLYRRDRFSDSAWSAVGTATAASSANATVTFTTANRGGQYMIGTSGNSLLEIPSPSGWYNFYPCPADDRLVITSSGPLQAIKLRFLDMHGRTCFADAREYGDNKLVVDVQDVPDGIYHITLPGDVIQQSGTVLIFHE